jgi:hypothetical protein
MNAKIPTITNFSKFPTAVVVGNGSWATLSNCWKPGPGIRRWRTRKYAEQCAATNCGAPDGCRGKNHHCVMRLNEPPVENPTPTPVAPEPVLSRTAHAEQFAKWMSELNAEEETA